MKKARNPRRFLAFVEVDASHIAQANQGFRVKTIFRCWYGKFKSRIQRRLDKKHHNSGERPAFTARNIDYDVSFREHGMMYGGIGAIHLLVQELGLGRGHRRTSAPPQDPPALSRVRPRPQHRLQRPVRRHLPPRHRTAPQRRSLPRCPGCPAYSRSDHGRRLLPPLQPRRHRQACTTPSTRPA